MYTLEVPRLGFLSPGILQDDPLGEEGKDLNLYLYVFFKRLRASLIFSVGVDAGACT